MVSKQEILFIMCTLAGEDVKNMGHVCSIDLSLLKVVQICDLCPSLVLIGHLVSEDTFL